MNDPSPPIRPDAWKTLLRLIAWGFWLRVAAADVVHWVAQRRGVLCVFPDTRIYWELASKLRLGEPYELTDFGALPHFALRTPGYPLFLAFCQMVFGPRVLPIRLVQAALGAWCVWLTARLVRRALPADFDISTHVWTISVIAAAFVALDPFVVANSALILSEALFLPLMLLAQCGLSALWETIPRGRASIFAWSLLTGAASGAAILVRPSWALYVPAALLAWVVLSPRGARRSACGRALLVALVVAAVMSPWWVRNYRIYGRFVPTALWMGASLYDGLNPSATGASDMDFLADPAFWPLDEEAQDRALRDAAVSFARAHPSRVAWLAVAKSARFWSPWPNAEGFTSFWLALPSALIVVPQYVLILIGSWNLRRDRRALVLLGLPLAYTFALHLLFVSSMRYRIPVIVPALGLAAVGLSRIFPARWANSARPIEHNIN